MGEGRGKEGMILENGRFVGEGTKVCGYHCRYELQLEKLRHVCLLADYLIIEAIHNEGFVVATVVGRFFGNFIGMVLASGLGWVAMLCGGRFVARFCLAKKAYAFELVLAVVQIQRKTRRCEQHQHCQANGNHSIYWGVFQIIKK